MAPARKPLSAKKPRPRTGEPRQTRQPLYIDRLPPTVHEAIKHLYSEAGMTWKEIERLSSEPFNGGKGPGFIDWDALPTAVLELFPNMRLPDSNLQRWFDLRVAQVTREVMFRSAQAREIAQAFAKSVVAKDDEAVVNAARDIFMGILSSDGSAGARIGAAKGLVKLSEVMQKVRTNDIRERKVEVEEQTLQIKLDEIKRRAAALVQQADGNPETGAPDMTRDEVLRTVKDIYGVA